MMQIQTKKLGQLFIFLVISFVCSSCSTTPKIQYQTVLQKKLPNNISVSINAFNDEREEMDRIVLGTVQNGYGMDVGDVNAPPELFSQVKNALNDELKNSGYTLTAGKADLIISATLTEIVCDVHESTSAQITIKFKLMDGDKKVMDHAYHGENSKFILPVNCSKPLNKAIQNLMGEFVSDLNRYVSENSPKKAA